MNSKNRTSRCQAHNEKGLVVDGSRRGESTVEGWGERVKGWGLKAWGWGLSINVVSKGYWCGVCWKEWGYCPINFQREGQPFVVNFQKSGYSITRVMKGEHWRRVHFTPPPPPPSPPKEFNVTIYRHCLIALSSLRFRWLPRCCMSQKLQHFYCAWCRLSRN